MNVWLDKNEQRYQPRRIRRPLMSVLIQELLFPSREFHRKNGHLFGRYPPRRYPRLQGLSLQGPSLNTDSLRRFNSEYKHPDDKNSESAKKLRSWSTITSGSIISRKHKGQGINGDTTESLQDVRFFAELVKPLQYRLRIHEKEEKEKVLFPSKYGFHQRSHSPTFRRLLEATEKLKIIAGHETVKTLLKQNANVKEKLTSIKKAELEPEEVVEQDEPKTPEITTRNDNNRVQTTFVTNDSVIEGYESSDSDIPGNVSVISEEPFLEEDELEDEDFEDEKLEQDHSFKVDFKVEETHAELHLFLPKINSGNKSTKSNKKSDLDEGSVKTDRSDTVMLPAIKVDSIHQIKSYQSPPGKKFKRQDTFKRKKRRPVERIKSAADPDKKIKDHLNDVHTLISIEAHHSSHRSDSICNFEHCPYHSLLKKTQETLS